MSGIRCVPRGLYMHKQYTLTATATRSDVDQSRSAVFVCLFVCWLVYWLVRSFVVIYRKVQVRFL